ncbi:MAG: carboxypeptidase regulatory-like domain-containing protein [Candidatus Latescibacteria bacterium]|nr:carboxypeptidase regulatory-like domain-containing protein [Candidatus Latescibacterota bacterium]
MKKLFALLLILLVAVMAGCLTSDSDDDDKDEVTGGKYTVTGKVVNSSGSGISGVTVTLIGQTTEKSAVESVNLTVSTTSEGNYTFQNIKNGTYVVGPAKANYTFEPSSRTVQVSGSNATVSNFVGTESGGNGGGDTDTYTVSGRVIDSSGNGISGVNLILASVQQYSATTNANGNYTFNTIPSGSYGLVPTKSGYSFIPQFKTVIVGTSNVTVDNFTGSTDSGNGGDTGSGNAGTHNYFPMKTGATWTYHVKDTDYEDDEVYEYDYTSTVGGTKVFNDKEYWEMLDEDGYEDGYMRIENNILYVFGGDDEIYAKFPAGVKKTLGVAKTAAIKQDFLNEEMPMFYLNASAGTSYKIYEYSISESGYTSSMKINGKYVGTENVSVTAGSFSNCRKYEIIWESSITSSFYSESYVTKTTVYLAPNVGLVKSSDSETEDGEPYWLTEEELTSYNIP